MNSQDGNFDTKIDSELLDVLYLVGLQVGVDPLASIEAENYFLKLQSSLGDSDILTNEVVNRVLTENFISVDAPPQWLKMLNGNLRMNTL